MLSALVVPLLLAAPPAGATYCPLHELHRLANFDPADWVDGEPSAIRFLEGGRVELDYGQDGETCSFTAQDHGLATDFTLTCDGRVRRATWLETGPETVRTTLLSPGRSALVTRCTYPDMDALEKSFAQGYASTHRGRLAGQWRTADGAVLEVSNDGTTTLGGQSLDAEVRRCDGDRPRPCLVWKVHTDGGERRMALTLAGSPLHPELIETQIEDEVGYYPVDLQHAGRRFKKVSPAP